MWSDESRFTLLYLVSTVPACGQCCDLRLIQLVRLRFSNIVRTKNEASWPPEHTEWMFFLPWWHGHIPRWQRNYSEDWDLSKIHFWRNLRHTINNVTLHQLIKTMPRAVIKAKGGQTKCKRVWLGRAECSEEWERIWEYRTWWHLCEHFYIKHVTPPLLPPWTVVCEWCYG